MQTLCIQNAQRSPPTSSSPVLFSVYSRPCVIIVFLFYVGLFNRKISAIILKTTVACLFVGVWACRLCYQHVPSPRQSSKHSKDSWRAFFVFSLSSSLSRFIQLSTLRGSILEDAVPSTSKHGTTRGLPIKEVLEYLLPELDLSCLRLALNTPKVTEQLMKLDEQGVGRIA